MSPDLPADLKRRPPWWLAGLALALFLGDLAAPNGISFGISYAVLVLASLWLDSVRSTLWAAATGIVLAVVGAFLNPAPWIPTPTVVANRGLAIGAICITAAVVALRKGTARRLRSDQRRTAEILKTVPAAFVGMDDAGRITDWNRQAEQTFGWSAKEATGCVLAETIIPEEMREAHEKGLRRLLETREGSVLYKPIEMEAVRRDGGRFPVEFLFGSYRGELGERLFYAFAQDISERKRVENELRENQGVMASLAGRLISSHEDERRRLARDLHDDFSQRLAVWAMELGQAELNPGDDPTALLRRLRAQVEEMAEEVHELSHRLHPAILERIGLVESIRHECERFQEAAGVDVSYHADVQYKIADDAALALYRVTQEALRNVSKHAKASAVAVRLVSEEGRLTLSVADDGVGFDTTKRDYERSLGLVSMTERARLVRGELRIESKPGEGARLEMTVSLDEELGTSGDVSRAGPTRQA